MKPDRIVELQDFYRRHLLDHVVPFWVDHGVDHEYGGFLTCLERDGTPYSTDKSVWFAGRATWLFATLYDVVEHRSAWRELARHGYRFLTRHCFDQSGKMYFSVDREGRPLRMRRYFFSEVFAALACAALARIDDDASIGERGREVFNRLMHAMRTPGVIAPKTDAATRPMKSLSPAMCLVSVADAMLAYDPDPRYELIVSAAIDEIFKDFVRVDEGMVLETVSADGTFLDTPEGRVMNPGHAIETAWFLLEIARRRGDTALVGKSCRILDIALERGWDHEHGGILYFLDVAGKPSPYLEHDMKLWWVHSEALYATLLAHQLTGEESYARQFERVHAYTFQHFPDAEHGEWYGYLRRDGSVSTTLKGSMWKGPFHIPRALLLCHQLLGEMNG